MFRVLALFVAALLLASCGGDRDSPSPRYPELVSFGDSLSDVGTYRVSTVQALGGGRYTVNGSSARNWVEYVAADMGVPDLCAARTGLDGSAAQGFAVPPTSYPECTAYGQGGARVTNPIGPGNKALGGGNAILGQLTEPVVNQIGMHLARRGGRFSGSELVTILAGGNDVFMNIALVGSGQQTPDQAVQAMAVAGSELGTLVREEIVGRGATRVVLLLLPDLSASPFGNALGPQLQALVLQMVQAFNASLRVGLDLPSVLIVDTFSYSQDQIRNPAQYALDNVTVPACNLTPAANPLGSALICTTATLQTGSDPTRYLFADSVHPTPIGYRLTAQFVLIRMLQRGWR
ncbi:MAG: SGNH/GDSL hydrolase family protein [Betaproteobacteria bacterium]